MPLGTLDTIHIEDGQVGRDWNEVMRGRFAEFGSDPKCRKCRRCKGRYAAPDSRSECWMHPGPMFAAYLERVKNGTHRA